MVGIAAPVLFPNHIYPKDSQSLQIVIQALPVSGDTVALQSPLDLRHRDMMLIVGLLRHDTAQIIQFQLLIGSLWHDVYLLVGFLDITTIQAALHH